MEDHAIEIVSHGPRQNAPLMLTPVMDIETAKRRLEEFQQFIKFYLTDQGDNPDYGTIPGTPKPTLLKPGADKLCEIYGLSDDYQIVSEYSREDWDRDPPLFDYTVKCVLTDKRSGIPVASGLGSCNSYEGRYRYRDSNRKCPKCGKESIIKGKEQYGGGWLCFAKKGGCGAKFADGEKSIESQQTGKVVNDDLATYKNTIIKMAKKRAKVDATLSATRSSGIFTQDMEDISYPVQDENYRNGTQEAADGVLREKMEGVAGKHAAAGTFPKEVIELQKLLVHIYGADKSLKPDDLCRKYFVKKDGKGAGYDEVKLFHTAKQLQWVHGVCKQIEKDYASILPPPLIEAQVVKDEDIPF